MLSLSDSRGFGNCFAVILPVAVFHKDGEERKNSSHALRLTECCMWMEKMLLSAPMSSVGLKMTEDRAASSPRLPGMKKIDIL